MVYWKDTQCIYQGCNKNTAKLLNLASPADIIGKTDSDFNWTEERIKTLQDVDFSIIKHGGNNIVEDTIPVDGVDRIFLTSKSPLHNSNGKIVGILGISTDITERKQMEAELILTKEKTEAANYLMTEFISNMGHILVTPLSKITGVATELLYGFADKYLELKPRFEELMQGCVDWDKAYSQVIRATSLGEMELKLESFSVNQELLTVKNIMEHNIDSKKLKLIIQPFKPKDQDLIVSDKLKFHLIFIELFSNAIRPGTKDRAMKCQNS